LSKWNHSNIVVLILSLLALAAQAQTKNPPRAHPLVLDVGLPGSPVRLEGGMGSYISGTSIPVSVGSTLPRWRVSVTASPATSDRGLIISPDHFFIQPEGRMGGGQSCLDLGQRTVLLAGGPTGPRMMEFGTFRIGANIDPLTPAGLYRGVVRMDPEVPGGTPPNALPIPFEFDVPEVFSVEVLTDVVEFGSQTVGTFDCRSPALIRVNSNHPESEITVLLTELINPETGSILPSDTTVIGWGLDAAAARNNALERPFGANDLSIILGPGKHRIAIHARINLTTSVLAGDYSGRIEITSRVNQ
jgi:hypothetical protein